MTFHRVTIMSISHTGQLYSINTTNPAVRSPVFRTFVTGKTLTEKRTNSVRNQIAI